jgi:hypothetical protein
MNRPHSTYSATSTRRTATRGGRTGGYADVADYDGYEDPYEGPYDEPYQGPYQDSRDEDFDGFDDEIYEYVDPIDRRWIWVAGVAGAILLVAVICTVVILGGGDSGSVSKTIAASTPTSAPPATATAPPVLTSVAPPPAPSAPLSPETVTTIAPSPTAGPTATPTANAAPPPVDATAAPRTITYQVTGTRPLLDMVTVVYTDSQGALQTDFNVALPWARTVTLDPGVELKSVIATSLTGQLNCSVTDSSGATLVAQANNSMIATCTQ